MYGTSQRITDNSPLWLFSTQIAALAPILFVGYLIGLSWLLTRIRFLQESGLTRTQLILLYLLKIAAGIFYGWIGIYYGRTAHMTDTWYYHLGGLQEHSLLLDNPRQFFSELVIDPYEGGRWKLLGTHDSYWNDLKANALLKGLALFNLISGGHYNVNILFYNFFGLFGSIAFYRVLADRFPEQKTAIALGVFLTPSVLFWSSGIHKEGILLTALGLIVYAFHFSFKYSAWSPKRIAAGIVGLLLILVFRNHLLVALMPALFIWTILHKKQQRLGLTTALIYAAFFGLFFLTTHLDPRIDLPKAVATKQQEFLQLKGRSSLKVDTLTPTPKGFMANLPQAIDLSLTRPHLGDVRHLLSLAASLEVIAWFLIIGIWIIYRHRKVAWPAKPLDYFLIGFSLSVILLIGFSINNLGAIARYRSVIVIPLFTPLLAQINWRKLFSINQ